MGNVIGRAFGELNNIFKTSLIYQVYTKWLRASYSFYHITKTVEFDTFIGILSIDKTPREAV